MDNRRKHIIQGNLQDDDRCTHIIKYNVKNKIPGYGNVKADRGKHLAKGYVNDHRSGHLVKCNVKDDMRKYLEKGNLKAD